MTEGTPISKKSTMEKSHCSTCGRTKIIPDDHDQCSICYAYGLRGRVYDPYGKDDENFKVHLYDGSDIKESSNPEALKKFNLKLLKNTARKYEKNMTIVDNCKEDYVF